MAQSLTPVTLSAAGFLGLNTQNASTNLPMGFAKVARNCVIDNQGRLGSRKGHDYITTGLENVNIRGVHKFVDLNGVEEFISWSDLYFYSSTSLLFTAATVGTPDLTGGNWQAATLNDHAYFFQQGVEPLVWTRDTGSLEFETITGHPHSSGTPPKANTAIGAYGRIWAANTDTNKTTVYFSDLLDGNKWTGGTSGSLDISSVLLGGVDEIVALSAHNGYLVIFCKNNIIIYGDTDNFQTALTVTSLTLVDIIHNVGCIARDSVQSTGDDILFLSDSGLQSLGRVIQEKSAPIYNISSNIKDDLLQAVHQGDLANIKSVYSAFNSFYLLTMNDIGKTYCFNTKNKLEDGSYRATEWTSQASDWLSDGTTLYMTGIDGIATYTGYTDAGESYEMSFYTHYMAIDEGSRTKIGKHVGTTMSGASNQPFITKIAYDYEDIHTSYVNTLSSSGASEYGVSEYGTGEYSGGNTIESIRTPIGGSGYVIQLGIESTINGGALTIQQLSLYLKLGRLT